MAYTKASSVFKTSYAVSTFDFGNINPSSGYSIKLFGVNDRDLRTMAVIILTSLRSFHRVLQTDQIDSSDVTFRQYACIVVYMKYRIFFDINIKPTYDPSRNDASSIFRAGYRYTTAKASLGCPTRLKPAWILALLIANKNDGFVGAHEGETRFG